MSFGGLFLKYGAAVRTTVRSWVKTWVRDYWSVDSDGPPPDGLPFIATADNLPTGGLVFTRIGDATFTQLIPDTLLTVDVSTYDFADAVFARTGDATFTALIPDTILAYAGGGDPNATFARTGDATFTTQISDTILVYSGGPDPAATFARSGDATFTGET
jgi:hypothetical protein